MHAVFNVYTRGHAPKSLVLLMSERFPPRKNCYCGGRIRRGGFIRRVYSADKSSSAEYSAAAAILARRKTFAH